MDGDPAVLAEVQNIGAKVQERMEGLWKTVKEEQEKLKHAVEQIERLGGGKVEGDATLAEQVAGLEKQIAERGAAMDSLRTGIEQYTRQLPALAARHGAKRDPEYSGFWPNAERAAQFGNYVMACSHSDGEVRRACADQIVKGDLTLRRANGQFAKGEDFVKAMGESTDTAGGYLVPEEFMATIIRHVEEYGVARARLTKVPMTRERQTWPTQRGELTVYYPDEGVAPTASDLAFGQVALVAKKWAAYVVISKDLEEDAAVGLGELIAFKMARALAIAEDTNCFCGDGTAAYAGITGVLNSLNVATVTMGAEKDTFEEIDHDELVLLKYAVPAYVRKDPDCAYFMCSGVAGICERLKDGDGRPLYNQPREGFPLTIAGFPVVEVQVMPDTDASAASTKFIAFGSLGMWGMLGQRRTMAIARSDQVKWLEEQVAIKAVPRQDIQEAWGEAMAVLKTAAS